MACRKRLAACLRTTCSACDQQEDRGKMTEAKIRFNEGDGVDLPLAVDLLSALFKLEMFRRDKTPGRVRYRGSLFAVTVHRSYGDMELYDVTRLVEEDVLNLDKPEEEDCSVSMCRVCRRREAKFGTPIAVCAECAAL